MIKWEKGFTLIEILIALVILAIVGSITVVGLRSAILSQERISAKSARLADLQSAIIVIERDIEQVINRPIIDVNGARLPAVVVSYPADRLNLEFTRAGFINPFGAQNRSTLQRVSYAWDGASLTRTTWQELDRVQNTPFATEILLSGVNSFTVRFLDNMHQLSTPSPTSGQQPLQVPLAIEINLDVVGFGTVTRLIPLYGAA